MKKNFGLSRQFYWQLPRKIRNEIKNEVDAGFTIYNFVKISTKKEMRRKARTAGYKNMKDFLFNQMGKKSELI